MENNEIKYSAEDMPPFDIDEATEATRSEPAEPEEKETAEQVIERLSARITELEQKVVGQLCRATRSAGLPGAPQRNYYSPDEVRAMSPREVHENYDRICESMRHWQ